MGERDHSALKLTLHRVEDGDDIHRVFVREKEFPAGRDVELDIVAGRCPENIHRICGWRETFDQGTAPAVPDPSAGVYEGRGDR